MKLSVIVPAFCDTAYFLSHFFQFSP
jgi:hypothetical protein